MNKSITGTRSLHQIASDIRKDWGAKMNYAAKPYWEAMSGLDSITDTYGCDSAKTIILYFLSNATSWRGDTAKAIKTELKKMAGIK